MKILFVHTNFPAQFRHVAGRLADGPGNEVVAIGSRTARPVRGVRLQRYDVGAFDVAGTHPFARRFDLECRRSEQVLYSLTSLAASGFHPDVIVAHPGWGETLPLRTVFPRARIVVYCEFFYGAEGRDVGFDPEFPATGLDGHVALHLKNAATLFALLDGDEGVAPTEWQRSTYPPLLRPKIEVLHEGIDTDLAAPDPRATVELRDGRRLTASDEVVTFVSRNLEPLRGYHVFMRALPRILAERPRAHVLIVGGSGVSYGPRPGGSESWKDVFRREVAPGLDGSRVHFLGTVSHAQYLRVLQVSSAHVYLTYPFVLSWSMIEAMSVGCLVIGSSTPPVTDVLTPEAGLLVPFFDPDRLALTVVGALRQPRRYAEIRARAREVAVERFDLGRVWLPRWEAFVRDGSLRAPSRAARPADPKPAVQKPGRSRKAGA